MGLKSPNGYFPVSEAAAKVYYSENRLPNPNRKNLSRTLPIFKIN
ncbi:hypothetical protein [Pseudomonas phage vB_Pae_SG_Moreira_PyoP2]